METKILEEKEELACRALWTKKWVGTSGLGTSFPYLAEFEEDLEAERDQRGCFNAPDAGFKVVGPLATEKSYEMSMPDWADYYSSFFGHKGIVCFTSELSHQKVSDDYAIAWMKNIEPDYFFSCPDKIFILPSSFPYETPLSREILDFCVEYNLCGYIDFSIDLIKRCFPSVKEVRLQLEQDPEEGDEWVVIDFEITAEVEEVLERYDYYTELWVDAVPWPERDMIRLSYNLI